VSTSRSPDVAGEPFILPELHDEPGLHAAVTTLFADAAIAPGSRHKSFDEGFSPSAASPQPCPSAAGRFQP
jgi:hypothetical protein